MTEESEEKKEYGEQDFLLCDISQMPLIKEGDEENSQDDSDNNSSSRGDSEEENEQSSQPIKYTNPPRSGPRARDRYKTKASDEELKVQQAELILSSEDKKEETRDNIQVSTISSIDETTHALRVRFSSATLMKKGRTLSPGPSQRISTIDRQISLDQKNTDKIDNQDNADIVLVGLDEGEQNNNKIDLNESSHSNNTTPGIQSRSKSDFSFHFSRSDGLSSPKSNRRTMNDHYSKLLRKRCSLKEVLPISQWNDFQDKLKNESNVVKLEHEIKDKLIKDFTELHRSYYKGFIKLKQSQDKQRRKSQVDARHSCQHEDERVLVDDESKVFQDMYSFVKKMLFTLSENPRLMAQIIHYRNNISITAEIDNLVETFTNTFYESITEETLYQKNLLKFIAELLAMEISDEENSSLIFHRSSLAEKIIISYTKRQECQNFRKSMLKNPFIAIQKESSVLELDSQKIHDSLDQKKKKKEAATPSILRNSHLTSSMPTNLIKSSMIKPENRKSNVSDMTTSSFSNSVQSLTSQSQTSQNNINTQKSIEVNTRKNSTLYYTNIFRDHDAKNDEEVSVYEHSAGGVIPTAVVKTVSDEYPRDKFLRKRGSFMSESLSNELTFLNEKKIPKFMSKQMKEETTCQKQLEEESPLRKVKFFDSKFDMMAPSAGGTSREATLSIEVKQIIDQNVEKIHSMLSVFLESLFTNLYNMPIGIRIICKLIKMLNQQRYPQMTTHEINNLIATFLFSKWIIPGFVVQDFQEILYDNKTKNHQNLIVIGKIILQLVKGETFDKDTIYAKFNPFILEMRKSFTDYFDELTNIGDREVESLLASHHNHQDSEDSPDDADEKEEDFNIKSQSICISLENVETICHMIRDCGDKISKINPSIHKNVEKILYYNNEYTLFRNRKDLVPGSTLRKADIYMIFMQILYPKKLSMNYLEEYNRIQNFHKNLSEEEKLISKVKHVLKQVLVSIDKVNNVLSLSGHKNMLFSEILKNYEEKYYYPDMKKNCNSNQERIPLHISAKYLLTTMKQVSPFYTEDNWKNLLEEMIGEYEERKINMDYIIHSTKTMILRAIENIKNLCYTITHMNERQKKYEKRKMLLDFIEASKINVCITSPKTRQGLPSISKSKSLQSDMDNKIIILSQKECIHERFSFMKELTSNPGQKATPKNSQKDKMVDTHNGAHCDTIKEFIESFSNLPEVRDVVIYQEDTHGVNEAFNLYFENLQELLKKDRMFQNSNQSEIEWLLDNLEKYITRRFYMKVFPQRRTYSDAALYTRIKTLEWVSYDHLEIIKRNQVDEMWSLASQSLLNMDIAMTPLDKLDFMVESFKSIVHVLSLTSHKEESAGAEDTLPILIYVILKAAPSRFISNINFIQVFRSGKKMLSQAGYTFTHIKSAINFIETLNHQSLNMEEMDFERRIFEKEIEYDIFYLNRRPRCERAPIKLIKYRLENERSSSFISEKILKKTENENL